jgi:hypothetical protein
MALHPSHDSRQLGSCCALQSSRTGTDSGLGSGPVDPGPGPRSPAIGPPGRVQAVDTALQVRPGRPGLQ